MKIIKVLSFVIASLLVIAMITFTIKTNVKPKENAGALSEYESANIADLPENIVDENLDLESGLDIGNQAPDFKLESLNGETLKLSDYRGKTVMLNFWASWCPPCRVEMPHMETYYQEYKEADDMEILAVNMTTLERGSQEKVSGFVNELQLSFPVLIDEEGIAKDLYKVAVYPTTYIVNPEGVIVDKVMIPLDVEVIKWLIEKADQAV